MEQNSSSHVFHLDGLSVVTLLQRGRCLEACNPGMLQQRLIMGGRDRDENWAKLEGFKFGCATGCDFASTTEMYLPQKELAEFRKSEKSLTDNAKKVLDRDALSNASSAREEWAERFKFTCFNSCEKGRQKSVTQSF